VLPLYPGAAAGHVSVPAAMGWWWGAWDTFPAPIEVLLLRASLYPRLRDNSETFVTSYSLYSSQTRLNISRFQAIKPGSCAADYLILERTRRLVGMHRRHRPSVCPPIHGLIIRMVSLLPKVARCPLALPKVESRQIPTTKSPRLRQPATVDAQRSHGLAQRQTDQNPERTHPENQPHRLHRQRGALPPRLG